MISDDEEMSLRRGLAENPEHVWEQIITKFTPIIYDHLRSLTGGEHQSSLIDADRCREEVLREAYILLCCMPSKEILALKLELWFCSQVEKKFKELFLTALITLYSREISSYITKILINDLNVVEDCLQDTFHKAWQSLAGKYPGEIRNLYNGNPRAWLYAIARSKTYDILKDSRTIPLYREPPGQPAGRERAGGETAEAEPTAMLEDPNRSANPEEALKAEENRREVTLALETLPSIFEKPVRMHYLEEMKYSEIAQKLGIPEGTARASVHSGLQKLKRYLIVKEKLAEEKDVQEQVTVLWDRHQSVARFHFFENLSLDQIAQQHQWTLDKTKGYLYRGIEVLWAYIEHKEK